jgi:urease accessory protein
MRTAPNAIDQPRCALAQKAWEGGDAVSENVPDGNALRSETVHSTGLSNGQPAPQAQAGATGFYQLLTWTSPAYPTGAFSYSHGLEWAVESGDVRDVQTLVDYIDAVLSRGGGWIDAVLFARAHECAHDARRFDDIVELAAAFRGSSETALESQQQGAAFLLVTRKAWPHPLLDAFVARHADRPVAHSIAMALSCAAHEIPVATALAAWLHSTAANLVSAGVRLVPLGQTDGQISTARLAPRIAAMVVAALTTSLDDLGTSTPMLEIFSIQHETQYTRLFRS